MCLYSTKEFYLYFCVVLCVYIYIYTYVCVFENFMLWKKNIRFSLFFLVAPK